MDKPDTSHKFKLIGRVKDAQGLRGEIYVRLAAGRADWLDRLRQEAQVYLAPEGGEKPIAYPMEGVRPHKDGLVIKLQGYNDRTTAEQLKALEMWIPENYLQSAVGEEIYLHELLHFEVVDAELGPIGTIAEFSSNGPQDLLVVKTQAGREHLIPLVKPFIQKVDFEGKKLLMTLPPGLIE